MRAILSSTFLLLLCAALARSDTCYSCYYSSLASSVFGISDSSCVKPSSQTPTVSCSGGCSSDIYSSTVSRGCSSCFFSTTCKSCSGDRCNGDAAAFTTCYSCNSVTDTTCSSPSKGTTKTTMCSGQCTKSTTSYSSYDVIDRDCSSLCTTLSTELFGLKVKSTCCSGDYCNGSAGISMSLAATAAALLVYLLA